MAARTGHHDESAPMSLTSAPARLQWFRSFYWRIAVSFVLVMLAVIVAQSLMFGFMIARWNAQDPSRSPRSVAAAAAEDVGAALEANRGLDLPSHLQTHYGRGPHAVFVVTRDGRVAGNGIGRLPPEVLRFAASVLAGEDVRGQGRRAHACGGPVVTAPIQVNGELAGLVVIPPRRGGVLMTLQRWLSWPGTIVLVLGTIVAAGAVFAPARRRLQALEHAAEQLGRGELRGAGAGGGPWTRSPTWRQAFNRMAEELAARDEALRVSRQAAPADARRRLARAARRR